MLRTSSLIGHDALGSGNDGNAQATQDTGQLVGTGVDAQAGLGDAAKAGDDLLAAIVLQSDADDALSAVVDQLEVLDITLVQQDLSDSLLHVGSGHIHGGMLRRVRVANAGEHIRNRISDMHGF